MAGLKEINTPASTQGNGIALVAVPFYDKNS